jgi:flagellar biosynthesis chaperone FliJ
MKITINQALVLGKTIRQRLGELQTLRNSVANREIRWGANNEKTETMPQYDIKEVDKKVIELENFIYCLDSTIKQANAVTILEIDADVKTLLAPLS